MRVNYKTKILNYGSQPASDVHHVFFELAIFSDERWDQVDDGMSCKQKRDFAE